MRAPFVAPVLLTLAAALGTGAARAEVVALRGGTLVEGTVVEAGGLGIVVEPVEGGKVFFLASDVAARYPDGLPTSFTGYLVGDPEGLQTLVRHYRHPETGVLVTLVGAVHVADPDYFHALQEALDAHEVVLFEGVRGLDSDEVDFIVRLQLELKDFLGLAFQKDHIDYTQGHWINADMTWEEMREALRARGQELIPNMEAIRKMTPVITQMLEAQRKNLDAAPEVKKAMQETLKRIMGRLLSSSEGLFKALGIYDEKRRSDVLISLRNDRALARLEEVLADGKRSIAIFFGSAHLPDMERRLREDLGFRPVGERWLLAWRIDGAGGPGADEPASPVPGRGR